MLAPTAANEKAKVGSGGGNERRKRVDLLQVTHDLLPYLIGPVSTQVKRI